MASVSLEDTLDDLVDAWHEGAFPGRELEDVIRAHTSWTHHQFNVWASRGTRAVLRELCPQGFVLKQGYGNCRTCLRCGRDLDQHVPIAQ